jgi:hypothetical protein
MGAVLARRLFRVLSLSHVQEHAAGHLTRTFLNLPSIPAGTTGLYLPSFHQVLFRYIWP